jgi:hypothetical protein
MDLSAPWLQKGCLPSSGPIDPATQSRGCSESTGALGLSAAPIFCSRLFLISGIPRGCDTPSQLSPEHSQMPFRATIGRTKLSRHLRRTLALVGAAVTDI